MRKSVRPRARVSASLTRSQAAVLGRSVVVGFRYFDKKDAVEQRQLHGVIVDVWTGGLALRLPDGTTRTLPPSIGFLKKAETGKYRLRSTGEVVENPDFTLEWDVVVGAAEPLVSRQQAVPKRVNDAFERAKKLAQLDKERYATRVLPVLRRAAKAGHAEANYALGDWYFRGTGVRKNVSVANKYWEAASELGCAVAAFNVATSLEMGAGTRKNLRRSFAFYRRAVRAGDLDALYEMGRCLYYGIGTNVYRAAGSRLIDLAFQHGHEEDSE